jgi:hypothetical protein
VLRRPGREGDAAILPKARTRSHRQRYTHGRAEQRCRMRRHSRGERRAAALGARPGRGAHVAHTRGRHLTPQPPTATYCTVGDSIRTNSTPRRARGTAIEQAGASAGGPVPLPRCDRGVTATANLSDSHARCTATIATKSARKAYDRCGKRDCCRSEELDVRAATTRNMQSQHDKRTRTVVTSAASAASS